MSASARLAAARAVRRKYPQAVVVQHSEERWNVVASKTNSRIIGSGKFKMAAWRNAAFKLSKNG